MTPDLGVAGNPGNRKYIADCAPEMRGALLEPVRAMACGSQGFLPQQAPRAQPDCQPVQTSAQGRSGPGKEVGRGFAVPCVVCGAVAARSEQRPAQCAKEPDIGDPARIDRGGPNLCNRIGLHFKTPDLVTWADAKNIQKLLVNRRRVSPSSCLTHARPLQRGRQ